MSSIFISIPTATGHSQTITSKLGHILKTAEEKYGERDYSYTILGVEITDEVRPRIWYPDPKCKQVAIKITRSCLNNMSRAVFQVSHEAVHCLSPIGKDETIVLEEGLASLFSIEYTFENGFGPWRYELKKYIEAHSLVKQLLLIDPNIIKKLRLVEPTLAFITNELILKVSPLVPIELTKKLTTKF